MGHVPVRYVSHYQRVNVNPQVQKIEVLKYLAKVDPINPGKKNASFLNITHLNLKISLVISQPILDTQQQIRYIIPYQKTKGLYPKIIKKNKTTFPRITLSNITHLNLETSLSHIPNKWGYPLVHIQRPMENHYVLQLFFIHFKGKSQFFEDI